MRLSLSPRAAHPRIERLEERCLLTAASGRFLESVYGDLLGRLPDGGGRAFWTGLLDRGVSSFAVVQGISTSTEFRDRTIDLAYRAYLGRTVDTSGHEAAIRFLASGGTTLQLRALILGSPEYLARTGGTTDGFLRAIYRDVLDRDVDPSGAASFGGALNRGFSQRAVASAILTSPEARRSQVRGYYAVYLYRSADEAGLDNFVAALANGASAEEVIASFVGSAEYATRFVDKTPPLLTFSFASDPAALHDNPTLVGQVSDDLSGVATVEAQVDGGVFVPVTVDGVGSFRFTTSLPLDGSADGPHRVGLRATDGNGNISGVRELMFPLDTSLVNRAVTTASSVQQMPSVAVDPLDSKHVVIAYMDRSLVSTGYAGIGVAVSRDNGTTWRHSVVPLPAGFDEGAANPIARFDANGHLFVSYMAATFMGRKPPITNGNFFNPELGESDRAPGVKANNGVFVVRSDDGGINWQQPMAVVSHLYQGQDVPFEVIPDLAVDKSRMLPDGRPNPRFGTMYVTWTRLFPTGQYPGHPNFTGGGSIMIAVSRDGGRTWESQMKTDPVTGAQVSALQDPASVVDVLLGTGPEDQAHLTIGPEGDIYVSNFGIADFVVQHSTDGGASFTIPDHGTGQGIAFGVGMASLAAADGLPQNHFRTHQNRAIAADPMRAGQVYAVDHIKVVDAAGNAVDPADIFFARSTDYGQTWQPVFRIGSREAQVLNDDNSGQKATGGSTNEVAVSQTLPQLAVDSQGNIGVIWLDARRDPADHLLDVFGTLSTDGGRTFSPNFRVTDHTFDADQGKFTDAAGKENFYLGDFLGLALASNTVYASWTDTRNGNQDVFFSRFPVDPVPAPPNDRFEPNDRPDTATQLGRVIQRIVPKLGLPVGDEDWFVVQGAATGNLIVSALFADSASPSPGSLRLELWDRTGTTRLASGADLHNDAGQLLGQEVRFPGVAGQDFLVRVFPPPSADSPSVAYFLRIQSLTADLGTRVFASVDGMVAVGGGALYLVRAAAPGSLQVQLTNDADVQGDLHVQVLDPETFTSLVVSQPALVSAPEPNDSIPQAIATSLTGSGSVRSFGTIGDGLFGTTSGDYDFYSFHTDASQKISVDLNARIVSSSIDGFIALYDSTGQLLTVQDAGGPGASELLTFVTTKPDTYYVAILGYGPGPPADPFTAGTGGGIGSTGAYLMTITTEPVGAGAVKRVNLPVQQGQRVVLLVTGDPGSHGRFNLQLTNQDQFTTPAGSSLLFPAGAGPSQAALGDLNRDGKLDIVVANAQSDTISLLLGNGDGTFQAPRQFGIGAFVTPNPVLASRLGTFRRQVVLADFSSDNILDVAVTNYDSADVSVLLGRGDGTFEPQRRVDATRAPYDLTVGDFNGDGHSDLAAVDSTTEPHIVPAVLLGRGNGTFQVQRTFPVPFSPSDIFSYNTVRSADLNGDGEDDLVITGTNLRKAYVFLSNGDGTFAAAQTFDSARLAAGSALGDVNGDGILDLVTAELDDQNLVAVLLGNGDGTFQARRNFFAGQNPIGVAIADFGSQVSLPGGSTVLGPPDGHPDLTVAVSGIVFGLSSAGPPEVVVLPGLVDAQGQFAGFGSPQQLAPGKAPQDVDVGDLNGDGFKDVVVVDRDGVRVIFGKKPVIPPNDTPQTARNLGTVVHLVEPTLTIVPGHTDAYYTLTVPTEAARGSGDEVIDFSGLFQAQSGAGISMEVSDAAGNLLGSGERFRVVARQGQQLTLHVFGVADTSGQRGSGAYTLDIDVLPQVVSVEAIPLLPGVTSAPGGPTTSLVVTLQGDRLDPAPAENPANYVVTWLGPDGLPDTSDDRVLPIDGGQSGGQSIVYDPSANVDVSSGTTFPTAVRQTLTLLFRNPLPAGNYRLELKPGIVTAPFNAEESGLLSPRSGFSGHPVVMRSGDVVSEGARRLATDLVFAAGGLGSFDGFKDGTPFLEQLHGDLSALLDARLTAQGDSAAITQALLAQIQDRFAPSLGTPGSRPASMMVVVLDPVSFDMQGSGASGGMADYDLGQGQFDSTFDDAFFDVSGNVEVIVIVNPSGAYALGLRDVPVNARGGVVFLGQNGDRIEAFTDAIRGGQRNFTLAP